MAPQKDETGNRYGRLLVIEYAGSNGHNALWRCKCDCGNECIRLGTYLRSGHTRSCGCLHTDQLRTRNQKYHIDVPNRLHGIWGGMLQRCESKKSIGYKNYGGRGISVCEEWHDFVLFATWAMNNGYADNLTIERIDSNGNYQPDNCKWATMAEQGNNRRTNRKVTIGLETHNLTEWCKIYGISPVTVQSRLRFGWEIEKAITTSVPSKKRIVCIETGEIFNSAREASAKYGVSKTSISMAAAGSTKSSCGLHWKYQPETECPIVRREEGTRNAETKTTISDSGGDATDRTGDSQVDV